MYGDDDEDDDDESINNDNNETNYSQREPVYGHDRESFHSEIPVIQVGILFKGLLVNLCILFNMLENVTLIG